MDPNLGLLAASGLTSFLLKTTAEWLVCLLLVRIAGSARVRFGLWLTMLLGFVAQWMWMWAGLAGAASPSAAGDMHARGATGAGERIAVASGTAGAVACAMAAMLAFYAAVVAWRMLGALSARLRLRRAMHHRAAPERRLATTFDEALRQTAAHGHRVRATELWVLPGLPSPATLGWWQPRVIVPPVCETQDDEELKLVLWHELKHVERRDALWNALVRACRTLLWFHPCVHRATAALNDERELACDAAVVREHPQSRDVYASCLVRFARHRDFAEGPAVASIEMASSAALLTTRVHSILNEAQSTSLLSQAWRAAAGVALVSVMAATVPALNILFAAEAGRVAMPVSMAVETGIALKRQPAKTSAVRMQQSARPSLPAAANAVTTAAADSVEHDEGLAAQHAAAMDILTESTGMDAAAGGTGRMIGGVSGRGAGRGTGGQASPSWTSVAVDAAARMGPMMGGRDGDDHH